MSTITTDIGSADIVVFQSSSCPYCQQAVAALRSAGLESRTRVINASSEQRSALSSSTGSTSVPSIWVKGKFVGGCNDGPEPWMGIRKLINNGKLTEMLQ